MSHPNYPLPHTRPHPPEENTVTAQGPPMLWLGAGPQAVMPIPARCSPCADAADLVHAELGTALGFHRSALRQGRPTPSGRARWGVALRQRMASRRSRHAFLRPPGIVRLVKGAWIASPEGPTSARVEPDGTNGAPVRPGRYGVGYDTVGPPTGRRESG